jgi:hypothetical protein
MSIPQGFGHHIEFATPSQIENFTRLTFISEPLWVWSLTFTKISIALMFFRIQRTSFWKAVMSFAIFYLVASAAITTSLQFTECVPLRMYWDPTTPGGKCRTPHSVQMAIIGTSGTFKSFHSCLVCRVAVFVSKLLVSDELPCNWPHYHFDSNNVCCFRFKSNCFKSNCSLTNISCLHRQ